MIAVVVLSAVLLQVVNVCSAAPASRTKPKPYLIKNEHVYDNHCQFELEYSVEDGTSRAIEGMLVPNDKGDGYVMIRSGSYDFIGPDNVKTVYVADKDGFKVIEYPLPNTAY